MGIPQGTAVSAVLANVYMIDFDEWLAKLCEKEGGLIADILMTLLSFYLKNSLVRSPSKLLRWELFSEAKLNWD